MHKSTGADHLISRGGGKKKKEGDVSFLQDWSYINHRKSLKDLSRVYVSSGFLFHLCHVSFQYTEGKNENAQ